MIQIQIAIIGLYKKNVMLLLFDQTTYMHFSLISFSGILNFRFSIGQLPLWAKKHISEDTSPPVSLTKGVVAPKGRWAQRAERTVGVKSFYTSDSVIPFPGPLGTFL